MDHPFLLSCRLADWKDRVEQVKSKGQLGVANWPSTVGMKVDATQRIVRKGIDYNNAL
jgi:hypothetical protein